jgi:CheY-like chemotaxis protein
VNSVAARAARLVFVDDESTFLETVRQYYASQDIEARVTTDADECIGLVVGGHVDGVVTDLRMPGLDGLGLCERIRQISADCELVVLTGYDPHPAEIERLKRIGARVALKVADLITLLASFTDSDVPASARQMIELQTRVALLEKVHRAWNADLVEQLRAIPEPAESWILGGAEPFTVDDLLEDIRAMTPRGIEHINLWQSALRRLRKIRRS